jgi:hypothetical protein
METFFALVGAASRKAGTGVLCVSALKRIIIMKVIIYLLHRNTLLEMFDERFMIIMYFSKKIC